MDVLGEELLQFSRSKNHLHFPPGIFPEKCDVDAEENLLSAADGRRDSEYIFR